MQRPPLKRDALVAALRDAIIAGTLRPGALLPTRRQLVRRHGVSGQTVQAALDLLAADGFIVADGRRGTRVAGRPPHLRDYALVLPSAHSFYHQALADAAARLSTPDRRIETHRIRLGVDGLDDRRRFEQALEARRLAGLIAPYSGGFFNHWRSLETTDVLKAMLSQTVPSPSWLRIDPALDRFDDLAIERLRTLGCQRIGVVAIADGDHAKRYARLRGVIAQAGLRHHDRWFQAPPYGDGGWGRHAVLAMMHPGQDERPDGLLVLDEHSVDSATAALAELAVRPHVVAHCNFPRLPPARVPVTWLGYDAEALLRAGIDAIDAARGGDRRTQVRVLPRFATGDGG